MKKINETTVKSILFVNNFVINNILRNLLLKRSPPTIIETLSQHR